MKNQRDQAIICLRGNERKFASGNYPLVKIKYSIYINTKKDYFLIKFALLTSFFKFYKFTSKQREAVI